MILDQMRNALALTAVKHMGGNPIPELEFVMHPNKRADAVSESRLNDPELVFHQDGSWTFKGVTIRDDADCTNWRLSAVRVPDFCESCAMSPETCDCVNPRHICTNVNNDKERR